MMFTSSEKSGTVSPEDFGIFRKRFEMDLKFEKLIRLTESENDHEALSALRFAQGLGFWAL